MTPTGSVLAAITLATALVARPIGLRPTMAVVALWLLSTLPWLLTASISDAPTTSAAAGVEAFGLTAIPHAIHHAAEVAAAAERVVRDLDGVVEGRTAALAQAEQRLAHAARGCWQRAAARFHASRTCSSGSASRA